MIKWGILGAANIAKKALIPAIQRTEDSEVVAIASSSGKEKEVQEQFDIEKAYGSYEELLQDSEIEAVYIPLPNHLHKKWVFEAAEAGKHILCEKPASLTHQDVVEMIEICNENNVQFLEAFMYQFHPQHQRVKELIAEGEIGEVEYLRASFSFSFDRSKYNIRLDKEKGGGALWDVGCYGTHTAINVLDSNPIEHTVKSSLDNKYGVDVTSLVTLRMENGSMAQVDCSFNAPLRHQYEVLGTKGTIQIPFAYRPDANEHKGIVKVSTQNGSYEETIIGDQYKLQVETFTQAVQQNESLQSYHDKTFENIKLLEQLYKH
ncbi:Gfo/Idh/MocA family protein [Pontibacillus sp. HMF3514]|uniref:Gfo/Idh/MocA family protein n=1 Tax=Pontibacillus sp. HMF3514 TaxID=2692425 RepID=UPI001F2805C7|nr:Gfo/Idh/MocA family oxidoreductase [Pontibacillus sp. HMF3514]